MNIATSNHAEDSRRSDQAPILLLEVMLLERTRGQNPSPSESFSPVWQIGGPEIVALERQFAIDLTSPPEKLRQNARPVA